MRSRTGPITFLIMLMLGSAMALPAPAQAQSSCTALRAELSRMEGISSSRPVLKGQTAAALQNLRGQANRLRCNSFFHTTTDTRRCDAIAAQIRRIETQVASRQMDDGSGRRRQIAALLRKRGCDEANSPASRRHAQPAPSSGKAPARAGDIRTSRAEKARAGTPGDVSRNRRQPARAARTGPDAAVMNTGMTGRTSPPQRADGKLRSQIRTVCVRLCDGYYFPISYGRGRQGMAADGKICQARCPGAQTRLYYQSLAEGSDEELRAVDDDSAYEALPNAYTYRARSVSNANCSCQIRQAGEERGSRASMTLAATAGPDTRGGLYPESLEAVVTSLARSQPSASQLPDGSRQSGDGAPDREEAGPAGAVKGSLTQPETRKDPEGLPDKAASGQAAEDERGEGEMAPHGFVAERRASVRVVGAAPFLATDPDPAEHRIRQRLSQTPRHESLGAQLLATFLAFIDDLKGQL